MLLILGIANLLMLLLEFARNAKWGIILWAIDAYLSKLKLRTVFFGMKVECAITAPFSMFFLMEFVLSNMFKEL